MDNNRGQALLRAWMAEHKHTQATFAALIKSRQANVSSWLLGRQLELKNAIAIRDATGIPVDAWIEPAETKSRRLAKVG